MEGIFQSLDAVLNEGSEISEETCPGKTAMDHVSKQGTRPFLQGLLLASKVNLNSLRLSGDIQSPSMTSLRVAKFWKH